MLREAAGRDRDHDEVGAVERVALVGRGRAPRAGCRAAPRCARPTRPSAGAARDRCPASTISASCERRRVRDVDEQLRHPLVAAAADDHDPRCHGRSSLAVPSPERDLDLDLDRATARQRGDADRRAGVAAGVAEHVVRAAGSRRRRPRAAATKPGAHATNPSTVSTRSMRSRSPSSARSTDSAFSAHHRAASAPCSTVTSAPSRPGCTSHAVVVARQLARRAGHAAVDHDRVERIVRRVRARAARCPSSASRASTLMVAPDPSHRSRNGDRRARRATGARRRTRRARARRSGAPQRGVHARASCRRRVSRPSTREQQVVAPGLDEQRPRARPARRGRRARARRASRAAPASRTCSTGTRCAAFHDEK